MRFILLLLFVPLLFSLQTLWTSSFNDVPVEIAVGRGYVVVAGFNGEISIHDYFGRELLTFNVGDEVRDMALYDDGGIAVLTPSKLTFYTYLGEATYEINIKPNFGGAVYIIMPFIFLADKYVGLFYLDLSNRDFKMLWGFKGLNQVLPSSLRYHSGVLSVADATGKLYLISEEGKILMKLEPNGPIYSTDFCAGKLAVGSKNFVKIYSIVNKVKLLGMLNVSGIALVSFDDSCSRLAVATTKGDLLVTDNNFKVVDSAKIGRATSIKWERGLILVGTKGKIMAFSTTALKEGKGESTETELPSLG